MTLIAERIYQALNKNGETWAVALDILKASDKVCQARLLHRFKGYGISRQIYHLIQFLLSNG